MVKKAVVVCVVVVSVLNVGFGLYVLRERLVRSVGFDIEDRLGGNVFPSLLLAEAATDTLIVRPEGSEVVGNPKSGIYLTIESPQPDARLRVEVEATRFWRHSVSEFVLPVKGCTYDVYPDVLWDYDALRAVVQAEPVGFSVQATVKNRETARRSRTFSVRSLNECLTGYLDSGRRYHNTGVLFAAYVNEDSPLIDDILREALNTRIVDRFSGYQSTKKGAVDRQVYALWHVLQLRKFRYSSISNTSLSSNVVFAQRVRTLEDALASSQINCVDGSVLFASLLRAVNIDAVLVRVPGHMFVGYYTDADHRGLSFLETTMIGDVDLDDFFPEEKLDSVSVGMSRGEVSRLTFEKSKEYACARYRADSVAIHGQSSGYMFLEISKALRSKVQPIGR